MCRNSVSAVGVVEALSEIVPGCDWRIFVGTVAAGDQNFVIGLDEESQRLTGAGASNGWQQNPVALRNEGQLQLDVFTPSRQTTVVVCVTCVYNNVILLF